MSATDLPAEYSNSHAEAHRESRDALRSRAERLLKVLERSVEERSDHPELAAIYEELMVFHIELDLSQDELFESRARMESLLADLSASFELAPFGYIEADPQGMVHKWNLLGAELFGTPRCNLAPGKVPLVLVVDPADHATLRQHLNATFQYPGVHKTSLRLRSGESARLFSRRLAGPKEALCLVAIISDC